MQSSPPETIVMLASDNFRAKPMLYSAISSFQFRPFGSKRPRLTAEGGGWHARPQRLDASVRQRMATFTPVGGGQTSIRSTCGRGSKGRGGQEGELVHLGLGGVDAGHLQVTVTWRVAPFSKNSRSALWLSVKGNEPRPFQRSWAVVQPCLNPRLNQCSANSRRSERYRLRRSPPAGLTANPSRNSSSSLALRLSDADAPSTKSFDRVSRVLVLTDFALLVDRISVRSETYDKGHYHIQTNKTPKRAVVIE